MGNVSGLHVYILTKTPQKADRLQQPAQDNGSRLENVHHQ